MPRRLSCCTVDGFVEGDQVALQFHQQVDAGRDCRRILSDVSGRCSHGLGPPEFARRGDATAQLRVTLPLHHGSARCGANRGRAGPSRLLRYTFDWPLSSSRRSYLITSNWRLSSVARMSKNEFLVLTITSSNPSASAHTSCFFGQCAEVALAAPVAARAADPAVEDAASLELDASAQAARRGRRAWGRSRCGDLVRHLVGDGHDWPGSSGSGASAIRMMWSRPRRRRTISAAVLRRGTRQRIPRCTGFQGRPVRGRTA